MSGISQMFRWSHTGKITAAYIGVLVLLAVIASGRLYISREIEGRQASSAAEINVSGRQRMLSQRIALYGARMTQATASEDIAVARKKMLDAVSLMERSHDALVNGDNELGVEAPASGVLRGLYFNGDPSLDKEVREFVATAKYLSKDSPNFLLLDRLVFLSGDILPRLDAVVAQYQKESEDAVLRLQNITNAFYGGIILVLVLSGLFVFRPFVQRLKDMIEGQVQDAKRLKALIADLEKASKAKNEFLSSMSHELRTPLNAIMGFAQLLETDDLDESQQESVRHILKGGNHLLGLVKDVLDLEGISSGKISLSVEDVHPAQPLAECLNMARFMAKKYDITLEGGPFADDLPYVRVDQTRFKQVLLNFLSNAVKYNREQGRVDLTVGATDQCLRVTVADTGPGIPEKKQKKLFVPFERLGMEGSVVEGTGIGLAITKELLELMGGRFGFASEEGKGSSFWFEVPLATGSATDELSGYSAVAPMALDGSGDVTP